MILTNNKGCGCVTETGPDHCISDTMPASREQYACHNNLSLRIALRVFRIIPSDQEPERERGGREKWGFTPSIVSATSDVTIA